MITKARRVKKIMQQESGKVLVMALILLVMGSLILTPLLGLMSTGLHAGRTYDIKAAELYAADAGVEAAIHWLMHGRPDGWGWVEVQSEPRVWLRDDPDRILINGKEVAVTVEEMPEAHTYKVTARIVGPEPGTTVMSMLWAVNIIQGCHEFEGPGSISGDVYITGDADVSVNAQVDGDLVVGGELTLTEGETTIEGDVSVTGDITLNQGSEITGNVCTLGNLILRNNTAIVGDVFVGKDLEISNNVDIHGDVFIFGNIIFANNANSRIWGNVYAYGDISITLGNPNSEIFGHVYSTGSVTAAPAERAANNIGGITEGCEESDYPEQPPCPELPVDPTRIYTYEIS